MDLTPTEVVDVPKASKRRSTGAYAVLVVAVVLLGVVVYQALSSASLYFYNADEAVAQRTELGDKRFRLQGTVIGDTIEKTDDGVNFSVAYNGVRVATRHDGDPPELFEPGIPVVLEGRWDAQGDWFDSDRILVKHSETYESENEGRLKEAEEGGREGARPSTTSTTAP